MPPTPSSRFSPGKELRGDNHKRGRSLEGERFYREKDDNLTLFNEMETMEKDNFLLHSNDDFEDILSSKMRYFSSDKLGVSTHARGESSDLLNADEDKNDYDWLLTPPDTPLFRSLDDETPAVTLAQRGRPRSKPMTISRSSTMEKSYTSSKGSASPNRLSLSPQSQNNSIQSRGRPSSAPRSSPTHSLRGTTPPRGPSPPPRKPSTPVPRSSTPTSRRMSPVPGGNSLSFGKRGVSPVNKSRGNSASPKAKALANIPDILFESPPNLRTSLGDRPSSYARGSSPASRSASSSHSRDRSKGSIASSGDDDVDSLHSVAIKSSDHSGPRRGGAYTGSHGPSLSKKLTRPGLLSSAPKRSFDSPVRQMDHQRKSPQNMFRPLLSSVPSSNLYIGKSTSAYCSLISRNSSVTTSSTASSEPGPSGAHEDEGLAHNEDDFVSTHEKEPCTDVEDDIFILEKADAITENVGPVAIDRVTEMASPVDGSVNFDPLGSPRVEIRTPKILEMNSKIMGNNSVEDGVICSECGCIYPAKESIDGGSNLCPDCRSEEPVIETSLVPGVIVSEVSQYLLKNLDDSSQFDAVDLQTSVAGSSGLSDVAIMSALRIDENVDETHVTYSEKGLNLLMQSSSEQSPKVQVFDQPAKCHNSSDGDKMVSNTQHINEIPNLKLDVSEGTGISILLKRSSSVKGPLVQSRSFTASSISFDDLSYVRDFPASMRSSTSSFDVHLKHRRSGSSLSGTSSHTFHGLGTSNNNEIIASYDENEVIKNQEQTMASEIVRFDDECTEVVCHNHDGIVSDTLNDFSISNIDNTGSYGNVEDFQNEAQSLSDGEDGLAATCDGDLADVADIPTHSQLETISEIEIENGHPGSPDSQSDDGGSTDSSHNLDESLELSTSKRSNKDVSVLVAERVFPDHAHDILEESTVTVELGTKAKSLTLEEATDAILFCSSIVHNIAYKAATVAIEKEENSIPPKGPHTSVTILGNSNLNNIKGPRGKTSSKRTPKSQKTRKRQTKMETETETDTETKTKPSSTDEKSTTRIVGVPNKGDSMKPPKLESKCNCTIM